jgi:VCBS repeat-containing protein
MPPVEVGLPRVPDPEVPAPVSAGGVPPLLSEINIAATHFRSPGEREFEAPLLDINYGLGNRIQLKYEVPYIFDRDEGAPYRSAVGNSLIGVKWRFFQQSDEKGWNISTYPQVEVNNPFMAEALGLVDRGPRFLLPVEITKEFGPVQVNFEGGYWFTQDASNERILGLAFGHQFTERFQGLAEIYDDVVLGGTARSTTVDIGGRYEFHKGLVINFMAGRRIIGSGIVNGQPSFVGYLGLQVQLTRDKSSKRRSGH